MSKLTLVLSVALLTVASGVRFRSATNATLAVATKEVGSHEAPCGNEGKTQGFAKSGGYLEKLLKAVCSLPTAAGYSCEANLACPLKEYYTQGCPTPAEAVKADICEVCTSPHQM